MEELHQQTLKKQKQTILGNEKNKRDAWLSEKTNEIKEITIKGLEPEIQKIISKHKQEQLLLKEQFENEMRKQKEQIVTSYEVQLVINYQSKF